MAIFKGAGVAIATPMKENLEINFDKLDEMLEEQIAGGTDAIIICGTTGESATMTEAEHAETIRFAVERVNHRIPVIAGTGSNCTRTAIELSKEAEKDGADGLLLVTLTIIKQPRMVSSTTILQSVMRLRFLPSSTMYQAVQDVDCSHRQLQHW